MSSSDEFPPAPSEPLSVLLLEAGRTLGLRRVRGGVGNEAVEAERFSGFDAGGASGDESSIKETADLGVLSRVENVVVAKEKERWTMGERSQKTRSTQTNTTKQLLALGASIRGHFSDHGPRISLYWCWVEHKHCSCT